MGLPCPELDAVILRVAATGNQVPRWDVQTFHQLTRKGKSVVIVTVGIDLAKNVFSVHGVDAAEKPVPVFTD